MSRRPGPHLTNHRRFPRVSGDEPGVEGYAQLAEAFSPRERG